MQVKSSAILSAFIKLPFVIKIFVLPIFEWPRKMLGKHTTCSIVLIWILTTVIIGGKVYHMSLNIHWPQYAVVGK